MEEELSRVESELRMQVCIDRVSIVELSSAHRNGTYNPLTRRVRLRAGLSGEVLPRTLRHEVCHGIDLQNDLVRGREEAFPYLSPPPLRDARLPNEAFADTCELGEETLVGLGTLSCPGDPDLRAAHLVNQDVFGTEELPGVRFEQIACYTIEEDPAEIKRIEFSQRLDSLRLLLETADGELTPIDVDPWTGAPAHASGPRPEQEVPEPPVVDSPWERMGGAELPVGLRSSSETSSSRLGR